MAGRPVQRLGSLHARVAGGHRERARKRAVKRARVLLAAGLIVASCLAAPPAISWLRGAESLPESLSDQEFWALSTNLSEPGGFFRSDNLLSNELGFPFIVADLAKNTPETRVYMGVG